MSRLGGADSGIAGLTERQARFCRAYLYHGRHLTNACKELGFTRQAGTYYLNNADVLRYLKEKALEMEERFTVKFEDKLQKLSEIAEACFPKGTLYLKKRHQPKTAVSAIAEMNSMQGHKSQELNIKTDKDVQEGNAILAQLVEENKKEY